MSLALIPPGLLAAAPLLDPHPAMIVPFVLLLLSIALMPFIAKDWWHKHYPHVVVGLGLVTVTYYLFLHNAGRMLHGAHEYVSFIALVGSLFVVSSGIHIRVRGESKPSVNCLFLILAALLSNLVGTTGASMLLIRPWIRLNQHRIAPFHVVFFIFLVSNVGGCLTPIGDPPLFLGYLRGVPFWWVTAHCWAAWTITVIALIGVFYFFDRRNFLGANSQMTNQTRAPEVWTFDGLRNLVFLAIILGAVFIRRPTGARELVMVLAALGSWWFTPRRVHQANDFSFAPIREVAWLFAGIFATMVPALDYLQLHAADAGLNGAMGLYWLSGALSSTLDNAPTYLSFLAAAMGRHQLSIDSPVDVVTFLKLHPDELAAISLGAVFFGAMTYIGNGPNFMVKSLAEQQKAKAPGFFPYLFNYALPILLPILALVGLLFFSRWRVF